MQREKAKHREVLQERTKKRNSYVDPFELETMREIKERNGIFSDLRSICLDRYPGRFVSYIPVESTSLSPYLYLHKENVNGKQVDMELHPIVRNAWDIFKFKGYDEKIATAQVLNAIKKSKIFFEDRMKLVGFIQGVLNIGKWKFEWINNPDTWKVPDCSAENQFKSLINHIFVKYRMPDFFYKVWYGDNKFENGYNIEWFINLAKGDNIRKQRHLPVELTKKSAHYMLTAPYFATIPQAIRWGIVLAMGGNETVARGVMETPLGNKFDNEDFWQTVVKFFIDNPMLSTSHYRNIYDYIYDQKYRGRGFVYVGDEQREVPPPQPNFSMKKREPNTLLLAVDRWHREVGDNANFRFYGLDRNATWTSCGIDGYKLKEKDYIFTIREITTMADLWEEGKDMHHCVASYARSCSEHSVAIYSLSMSFEGECERMATIEVSLGTKTIIQCRGRFNRQVDEKSMELLSLWSKKVGLAKSKWIS